MERKTPNLAERLQAVVEAEEAEQTARREASERRRQESGAARSDLLDRLDAFVRAVKFFSGTRDENGFAIRYRERGVIFTPRESSDEIAVTFTGWPGAEMHRIYREADLADRWVLVFRRHGREERFPLFDRGLEELMVHGLGVPRPAADDRDMSARTAAAMAGFAVEPATPSTDAPTAEVTAPSVRKRTL